ncbi:YraN family protein [Pseudoteredinibacter isoporae]|nr:YraN family protein [Pseudoteredinibacter isoporae]NHO88271.1 YraN family protein [Pseudoteredinibacter isoporae]NIB23398.1 YraN family protein [Pseudoteredinibacter isoporae]
MAKPSLLKTSASNNGQKNQQLVSLTSRAATAIVVAPHTGNDSVRRQKNTQEQGAEQERLAAGYLRQQGLQLQERNYLCPHGEIDLIMQSESEWVFVEVRSRRLSQFSTALESIGPQKQQRLLRSAEHFLASRQISDAPCRFDVVAISLLPDGRSDIEWLPNAFGA